MAVRGAARRTGAIARPFWAVDADGLLETLGATPAGLTGAEAARRLARDGPNALARRQGSGGWRLLASQFSSPIILILVAATVLSSILGDFTDGSIILVIILASGLLGFWQERGAGIQMERLLRQVEVRAEVVRDGRELAVAVDELVVGDVVVLNAGDVVPADGRVLSSRQLLVDESGLTGESFPVEKAPGTVAAGAAPTERTNAVFLGSHVASGSGRVVVAAVGSGTEYGALVSALATRDVTTGFERGMTSFGYLLVRSMVVLVSAIFVVNMVLGRPLVDSILFSLALAVGLTPQLLPAIVAVSLAAGAKRMARERVIVKRLDAIEDVGTMTVLCTDKTGTLTLGVAGLAGALDLSGRPSDDVLCLARLNAGLQQGFTNPLDEALLVGAGPIDPSLRLDEVPYDFQRRRLSVLVQMDGTPTLVTKGAIASVLQSCALARVDAGDIPLEQVREQVESRIQELSGRGYRVLGVATRPLPMHREVDSSAEVGMVLCGLLAFHDPVKPHVDTAIRDLADLGVSVRLVTGDNRLVARHVAAAVGLREESVLTGTDIDSMGAEALAGAVERTDVFAEVDPLHKERIVTALRDRGNVVGFLGDGINDSAALHRADVGISVDTAADVAKQAASIVLLDKDLDVVADGVRLGRRTFANTLKYVRVTTSANFGNMLSMAVAAAVLPFLPLLPRQILLLNLISDLPATTIAQDSVDPEQVQEPHSWDVRSIRTFMIVFGLVSSAVDLMTFAVLGWGFDASAELFRSGWFVQSTATELVALLVLRTQRPFWRSRPATALLITSALVAVVTVWLPFSPLAGPLGLVALPLAVLGCLGLLTCLYALGNEVAKRRVRLAGG